MIWEGNDAGTYAQNHAWMDLAVRPCVRCRIHGSFDTLVWVVGSLWHSVTGLYLPRDLQVFRCHNNHDRLLLFSIHIFNDTIIDQSVPTKELCLLLLGIHDCWKIFVVFKLVDVLLGKDKVTTIRTFRIVVNDE